MDDSTPQSDSAAESPGGGATGYRWRVVVVDRPAHTDTLPVSYALQKRAKPEVSPHVPGEHVLKMSQIPQDFPMSSTF